MRILKIQCSCCTPLFITKGPKNEFIGNMYMCAMVVFEEYKAGHRCGITLGMYSYCVKVIWR